MNKANLMIFTKDPFSFLSVENNDIYWSDIYHNYLYQIKIDPTWVEEAMTEANKMGCSHDGTIRYIIGNVFINARKNNESEKTIDFLKKLYSFLQLSDRLDEIDIELF